MVHDSFNRGSNLADFARDFLKQIDGTKSMEPNRWRSTRQKNPMRILYCNKYNFGFSGTEAYLFETMELMRSRGPR